MPINILYFGDIDTSALQKYYQTTIDLDNQTIELDLNFNSNAIAADQLDKLISFLEKIPSLAHAVKQFINVNTANEEVQSFLDFHKEELPEEDLDLLLENADKNLPTNQQILSVTQLRRIGLYPAQDDYFAVFDNIPAIHCRDFFMYRYIAKPIKNPGLFYGPGFLLNNYYSINGGGGE